ncbi:MAG: TraB/GumN family protein [Myxococcota bacterium]
MKWIPALLLLVAVGCATPAPDPDAGAINPLAFEIEARNGNRAVLFGSVHVGRIGEWKLPRRLEQALRDAQVLVLEIDLTGVEPGELGELMQSMGAMPPGKRLRQVVSAETWALLEVRAPDIGMSLDDIQHYKPWVVALHFMGRSMTRAGFETAQGVESRLVARDDEIPIRGLETPFEQFSVFDSLPYPVQDRVLLDALDPQTQGPGFDSLVEAWSRGDARRLEAIVFHHRDDPLLARYYDEAFDRRHLRMAEAIDGILAEGGGAFVVVGAGHLVGRRSLQAVLLDQGYRVRQLSGMPVR